MASTNTGIAELLRLRLIVAALGERLPKPWWRCQFLSVTGLRFMERVFPRRFTAAALESATVAARRDHDANIGARSYHLFRLPPHLEDQLIEALADDGLNADDLPDSAEGIMDRLTQLGSEAGLPSGSGPKSLGGVNQVLKPAVLGSIAGLYARAAQEETRIYPYFEASSDE